jgi:Tol biopolymer transport system component
MIMTGVQLRAPFAATTAGIALAPDGSSFVYCLRDSMFVRSLNGGDARFVVAASEIHSPAWSPDGRWIAYVAGNIAYTVSLGNIAPSAIWVVAAGGGDPIQVTDDQTLNQSPTFGPSGALLYVSSRDGGRDIYRVTLRRSGQPNGPASRLTTGVDALGVTISADGGHFAYSAFNETSNIWSMPIPSSGVASVTQAQPLTTGNQVIETFDVSPDNQWLVFDSDRNGSHQLFRMRIGGTDLEQLTSDSSGVFWPSWSPDGTEIAFHGFRGGVRQVFLSPAGGGTPVQLTTEPDGVQNAEWSPDGRRLLLLSVPARQRLRVLSRGADRSWSGPVALPLTTDSVGAGHAFWSPDGRTIATASVVNNRAALTLLSAEGMVIRHVVIASTAASIGVPQWSEDGRAIYYLYGDSLGGVIRVVPVTGGASRVVVRFDDPSRPWHRWGFRLRGGKFYFTLGDLQSDIWVTEIEK